MEEEIAMAETEQGEAVTTEGDDIVEKTNNSPGKRGRGRPQGSKKLKVCLSEVTVASDDPNDTPTPRGRGRPKLSGTEHAEEDDLEDGHNNDLPPEPEDQGEPKGSKKQDSDENMAELSSKKRGRPKKSLSQSTGEKSPDLPNGGTDSPKRGRPKGSVKRKLESPASVEEGATLKKRGRPKGSPNKKAQEVSESDEEVEVLKSLRSGRGRQLKVMLARNTSNGIPPRARGRPRKSVSLQPSDDSQPVKRGRGRPKGLSNKKPAAYKVRSRADQLRKVTAKGKKHGRPRLHPLPAKRGRPRKYPLPSPEELKKPKVWKPLGRPRKYPRVDPPEGAPSAPRRSRGRPRKSESKKGAHLRKNLPASAQQPYDGPPRKRGRPKKSEDDAPQKKRGRPKGSLKKDITKSDDTVPDHPQSPSQEIEAEVVEKEVEDVTMSAEPEVNAEETVIDQDTSCDVSEQA